MLTLSRMTMHYNRTTRNAHGVNGPYCNRYIHYYHLSSHLEQELGLLVTPVTQFSLQWRVWQCHSVAFALFYALSSCCLQSYQHKSTAQVALLQGVAFRLWVYIPESHLIVDWTHSKASAVCFFIILWCHRHQSSIVWILWNWLLSEFRGYSTYRTCWTDGKAPFLWLS